MMISLRLAIIIVVGLLAIGPGAAVCVAAADEALVLHGTTMGTTYQVKIRPLPEISPATLKARIDQRLAAINHSMSLYQADSEINRINAADKGQVIVVSNDLGQVLQVTKRLYRISGGALDPTVGPLVALWGFGRGEPRHSVPKPTEIETALAMVGFDHIELIDRRRLRKRIAAVTLDLGAIAKGYGVDQVAALVAALPATDFLVEIGGEVFAQGSSGHGQPWRVGINQPEKGGRLDAVRAVVTLDGRCLATSGDYRQFFELDGNTYSHVIDPVSGTPVANGVVSASVVAPNCILADGLATALMVMGSDRAEALESQFADVHWLLIQRDRDGHLVDVPSSGWQGQGG